VKASEAFREKGWPDPAASAPAPAEDHAAALVKWFPLKTAHEAIALLTARELSKLELMAEECAGVVAHMERFRATPPASVAEAHVLTEALAVGAKAAKELDALRTALVKPLNDEVKAVNALIARLTDPLAAGVTQGKRALVAFQQQERARVQREQDAARQAQEQAAIREAEATAAGDMAAAEQASREQAQALVAAPVAAPRGYKGDEGSASMRVRWVFEVIRPELVPRPYLSVDDKLIRAAVAAGVREIPGVSISQTEDVTVRVG
jgi:hypothetical protein